jgi:hypothetical protein
MSTLSKKPSILAAEFTVEFAYGIFLAVDPTMEAVYPKN